MAEAMLGRVALTQLEDRGRSYTTNLDKQLWSWLCRNTPTGATKLDHKGFAADTPATDTLEDWFEGRDNNFCYEGHTSTERIQMVLLLGMAGAGMAERAGARESAAREMLQVLEVGTQILRWLKQENNLRPTDTRPQPEANVREPKAELEAKVGELTKESMKRCQQLFFDARMGTGMQPQPRYFDVLCQLLSGNDEARCSLDSYLDQHLFPATTRLLALRGRAELELDRASPDMVKLLALLRDAVELAEQLQAPMHVGYAQLGITLTELWVKVEDKNVNDRKWLQTSALRYLRQSVEMVTQGNAYYEAIGPLYSPYDDFNDRRRHLQHALQMAGYDLCLHCIKRLENHANDTPQPTGTC